MKIPDSLKIGGMEYLVAECRELKVKGKTANGQVEYRSSLISINTDESSYEHRCVTLLHEALHAIANQADIKQGKREEHLITVLAYGIYQLLQDNGRSLFDIVPQPKEGTYIETDYERMCRINAETDAHNRRQETLNELHDGIKTMCAGDGVHMVSKGVIPLGPDTPSP